MAMCMATLRTHTCDLAEDHLHPHHCPGCGKSWFIFITEAGEQEAELDAAMRRHPAGKKKAP